jgi:threonine/homoserine/homoserine lactone efflux protein
MAKTVTVIFGVILVLLGILGFTSNSLIGANAYFVSDMTHNLMHIVLGGILLAVAFWAAENSMFWLKIIGAVIFLLGLIGVLTVPSAGGSLLGIASTNGASDWFHFIFGVVIFAAGIYSKNE